MRYGHDPGHRQGRRPRLFQEELLALCRVQRRTGCAPRLCRPDQQATAPMSPAILLVVARPLPGRRADGATMAAMGTRRQPSGSAREYLTVRNYVGVSPRRPAAGGYCPHRPRTPLFALFYLVEIRHRQPPYNDNPASARGDADARRDTL
jgi:hypothetical protein